MIYDEPNVTILMGVRNGADFLPEQLASIADQLHRNWALICSDDGSCDGSGDILTDFARRHPGQVTLCHGPQQGFSANYLSMIAALPPSVGYLCFADQDDIWHPGKIARSLEMLAPVGCRPGLYCGRQHYWYPDRDRTEPSPLMLHPCTLRNALAENVATGNTIMLSPAAARLARSAARRTGTVFAHDWWLYLLVSACGGRVIFDNGPPMIRYRQHPGNVIGAGRSFRDQLHRKLGVLRGAFLSRVDGNLAALRAIDDLLTPDSRQLINDFTKARQRRIITRMIALHRIGIHRQHWRGNLGFWGAASLGRV